MAMPPPGAPMDGSLYLPDERPAVGKWTKHLEIHSWQIRPIARAGLESKMN